MGTRVRAGLRLSQVRDAMGQELPPLSEQVPINSASTGQGSPLPEARARPGSEWVLQMVLQVSDRWGTSTSPCHLPFPRSRFPESPHAASGGSGAWP